MHDLTRIEEEQRLRRAILQGQAVAWEALYERTFDAHAAWVRLRCRDVRDLADEVIQESWMVAVKRIARFDPERAPFAAWLRGIAARVLADRIRLEQRTSTLPLEQPVPTTSPDLDERERIEIAMSVLPAPYREVLHAKYVERRSVVEIAEREQRSQKSVESMLSRARAAFRAACARL